MTAEDVIMELTDEEAEYALALTPDMFWAWYARREDERGE